MKKLIKFIVVLLVLLVAGVFALFFYIDRIAQTAVEQGATYALGVETTLAAADVGVLSGEFTMNELNVSNPEGFDETHFMRLGNGHVEVTLGSLMQDTVELPVLRLDSVELNLLKKQGKTNYSVILDHLKQFESGDAPDNQKAKSGKKFIIRELVLSNITVNVDLLPIGGNLTRTTVPIDEIRLTDIGSDTGKGVVIAELADVLIKAIIATAIQKGADLPVDILNDLGGALGQLQSLGEFGLPELGLDLLSNEPGRVIEDVSKQTEGLGEGLKGITEGLGDAAKGLGGLFPGSSKDDDD